MNIEKAPLTAICTYHNMLDRTGPGSTNFNYGFEKTALHCHERYFG